MNVSYLSGPKIHVLEFSGLFHCSIIKVPAALLFDRATNYIVSKHFSFVNTFFNFFIFRKNYFPFFFSPKKSMHKTSEMSDVNHRLSYIKYMGSSQTPGLVTEHFSYFPIIFTHLPEPQILLHLKEEFLPPQLLPPVNPRRIQAIHLIPYRYSQSVVIPLLPLLLLVPAALNYP